VFCISAVATTVNFEGFVDSTILTNQIAGLTFTNAIILSRGISLNEFEFPPKSGDNVVSDNGGPISIVFNPAVGDFNGFFTYSVPFNLRAVSPTNVQVGSVNSTFSNNMALSGVAGSAPNQNLAVSSPATIANVIMTGDPAGSSFTLDDATFNPAGLPPGTIPILSGPMMLVFALLLAIVGAWAARNRLGGIPGNFAAILVFLALGGGAAWLSAQSRGRSSVPPRIDSVNFSRTSGAVNRTATVTARITHPGRIPQSVNLIRLDGSGSASVVGTLHEDRAAGDGVYTLQFEDGDSQPGMSQMRISAAFHGQIRRVMSPPVRLVAAEGR